MTFNDFEVTTMIVSGMFCLTGLIVHFNPPKEKKIKRTLEEQMKIDEMPRRIESANDLCIAIWESARTSHEKLNVILEQTKKKVPTSARKRSHTRKIRIGNVEEVTASVFGNSV